MKKFFALFMCAVMLVAFTACGSIAEPDSEKEIEKSDIFAENNVTDVNGELPVSGVSGDYKFDEYSDHVVLTEYTGTLPSVYIPATIKGKPVTAFGKIFKGNLTVRSIHVGKNCTEIVDGAFENCYNLQRIEVVDGVKSIGKLAFLGCHSLKLAYLPACIETVADNAFLYCTDLVIYGNKGSAVEAFADKYASLYFRDANEAKEEETFTSAGETDVTETTTAQN